MIQLLFYVLIAEAALILLLLLKNPFKKFGLMGVDRIKRGRGPTIIKTIAATVFMLLCSNIYSIIKIRERSLDVGTITPTDEVLQGKNLLEASLMGFSLFLGLIIDRSHHYLRELRTLRKNMEAARKEGTGFDGGRNGDEAQINELEEEISHLRSRLKQLESDSVNRDREISEENEIGADEETTRLRNKIKHTEAAAEKKDKELKAAEANVEALRKQLEGLHNEYKCVLEKNEHLRHQLQSIDWNESHSDDKKKL